MGIAPPVRLRQHVFFTVLILGLLHLSFFNHRCFAADTLKVASRNEILDRWRWQTFTDKDGLNGAWITSVYVAPDSSIWFATLQGAVRYDGYHWTTYSFESDILETTVNCIAHDADGSIWFLFEAGIACYQVGIWQKKYKLKDKVACGYPVTDSSPQTWNLVQTSDGNFWASCGDCLLHFDGREWHSYSCTDLDLDAVQGLAVAMDGSLWIGSGTQASRFDLTDERIALYQFDKCNICHCCQDSSATIWCASDLGAVRFDGQRWIRFGPADSLMGAVMDIFADAGGSIWSAGSYNNSPILHRFDDMKWHKVAAANELAGRVATNVYVTHKGHIWVSVWKDFPKIGKGVYRFDNKNWQHYTKQEGLASDRCFGIAEAANGDVRIGSFDGSVSCFDGWGWTTHDCDLGLDSWHFIKPYALPDGSIWFAQGNANELQFSWRLDDEQWSPYISETEISVSDISMGHHKLEVRARDADMNVSSSPTVLEFKVLSPIWLRPWFLLSVVLVMALLIYQTVRVVRRGRSLQEMNVILEDLVERRTKALRLSEEQYRYLVENSIDGIFILQDNKFQFMNKQVAEILGYSENELGEKGLVGVIIPQQQADAQMALDSAMQNSKEQLSKEYKVCTKTGREIDIEVTGRRIEYRGRPAIQGVVKDVTERNLLQGQMLVAQKMEMVGSLAGGIAHDFNNILTTIMGYVSLLLTKIHQGDKHFHELTVVQEASLRASELTRQLLSFAQKAKYNPQLLNLNDTVDETLKLIRRTFPVRIEIRTRQEPNLYPILADPMHLRQVLIELCVNARDAIAQNGIITISTMNVELDEDFYRLHREMRPGKYTKIIVADNGIGMTPEVQKNMFEPFFTTKGMSSGMGLAIVFGIVKKHGGHFIVESELGKGTKFNMFFPVVEAIEKAPVTPISSDVDGGTLLVADDDEMVTNVTRTILQDIGYQVHTATSSKEALSIFRSNPEKYDLALLDVEMPVQSGTQMYQAMKKTRPDIKVVFCSGAAVDPATKEMWDEGVLDFLQKPFKTDTLTEVVRKAMAKVKKSRRSDDTT